ncbi:hypothetical protein MPH_04291 [Macrophomina phaseolina MS6]|uniref:Uncharacterized protein n=1 Tax=Macrophomina phaseolina (strain MS6) TaxID=1126212 RepID=K2S7Y2_MACPH|nr:hypothetical protein MPH_04291 [Macrophomina phaseolina MS6]
MAGAVALAVALAAGVVTRVVVVEVEGGGGRRGAVEVAVVVGAGAGSWVVEVVASAVGLFVLTWAGVRVVAMVWVMLMVVGLGRVADRVAVVIGRAVVSVRRLAVVEVIGEGAEALMIVSGWGVEREEDSAEPEWQGSVSEVEDDNEGENEDVFWVVVRVQVTVEVFEGAIVIVIVMKTVSGSSVVGTVWGCTGAEERGLVADTTVRVQVLVLVDVMLERVLVVSARITVIPGSMTAPRRIDGDTFIGSADDGQRFDLQRMRRWARGFMVQAT